MLAHWDVRGFQPRSGWHRVVVSAEMTFGSHYVLYPRAVIIPAGGLST